MEPPPNLGLVWQMVPVAQLLASVSTKITYNNNSTASELQCSNNIKQLGGKPLVQRGPFSQLSGITVPGLHWGQIGLASHRRRRNVSTELLSHYRSMMNDHHLSPEWSSVLSANCIAFEQYTCPKVYLAKKRFWTTDQESCAFSYFHWNIVICCYNLDWCEYFGKPPFLCDDRHGNVADLGIEAAQTNLKKGIVTALSSGRIDGLFYQHVTDKECSSVVGASISCTW